MVLDCVMDNACVVCKMSQSALQQKVKHVCNRLRRRARFATASGGGHVGTPQEATSDWSGTSHGVAQTRDLRVKCMRCIVPSERKLALVPQEAPLESHATAMVVAVCCFPWGEASHV